MTQQTDIPPGWEVAKLGDVMDVKGGSQPPKSEFIYEPKDGYIQLLQIRDFGDKPVPTYVPQNKVTKFCEKDDILIARYGASLGRIVTGHAGAYNVALAKTIFEDDLFDKRFVFYLLQTPILQTPLKMISRSAQNGFAKHEIAHVMLPIPPLNEQRRIVAKLEALFSELEAGTERLRTARAQLKTYRQAILKHAFEGKLTADWRTRHAATLEPAETLLKRIQQEREAHHQQQLKNWQSAVQSWEATGKQGKKPTKPKKQKRYEPISEEETMDLLTLPSEWSYVRLSEIADIGSGMSVSKNRKLEAPLEVAYLRVANVQRGQLVLDEIKTMLIETSKLPELELKPLDVLFNEGGDRDKLGRGWIWEGQIANCITQNHVFRASPVLKEHFHSKFISHWGNTYGQNYFDDQGKQTTNLASINKTVLGKFPVPLPPLEEQRLIMETIEQQFSLIDDLERTIDTELHKAESLRQSILKAAFAGKLAAQDPADEPASTLLARIRTQKASQPKSKRKSA